jgi:hypothetical protein
MKKSVSFSRICAAILSLTVVGYVLAANTTPFTVIRKYTNKNKNILVLAPQNRISESNGIYKQLDDLIYFNSSMPFKFNQANIKITYKNSDPKQLIMLGYHDQNEWHYNTTPLDIPWLDNVNWSKIGKGPFLYQKNPLYKSVDNFIKNLPQNKVIGVADYSDFDFIQPDTMMPNYQHAKTYTTINTPLRGKNTLYVYLDHETFNMSITKQDLNWYADPDAVKINVYKGNDNVYAATINDDGNSSSNHVAGTAQTIHIKNPGPGLPEPGVYKVVIDAPYDTLITKISTNLHKIAFEGPLYVADNKTVYSGVISKTNPTNLVTNAQQLSLQSNHGQSKTALVDKQLTNINAPNQEVKATNTNTTATITIPNSDMIVNGSGYFAFSPDQFFAPTPYKILPINSADDIAQADYILTNYTPPTHDGDWLVAERDYNLNDAVVNKRQLSWVLEAPGLKENNRTVEYKQIDMTLRKKGWFKQ